MTPRRPRFYFAFRSPYAWMTARMLEERFPAAHEGIDYVPFWEPDERTLALLRARDGEVIYTPMSRAKHLYILQDVKRLAAKSGYAMRWPVDVNPWWELPHLAYLRARRVGAGRSFFWAVYRARWERGEDVCRRETIERIAREVGLDPDALVGATEEADVRAEGVEALLRADRDGVFGVPFFCLGHEKFWGLDRFEDFAARFAPLYGIPRPALAAIGGYDTDCAGGCG
jgi:2-hydroxychromene-2-carboxylate isomerase